MSATLIPGIDLSLIRRRRRSQYRPGPCPCGTGCGVKGLCEAHRARLAAIRQELEGGTIAGAIKGTRGQIPTCMNEGCYMPRLMPLPVCSSCAEEAE